VYTFGHELPTTGYPTGTGRYPVIVPGFRPMPENGHRASAPGIGTPGTVEPTALSSRQVREPEASDSRGSPEYGEPFQNVIF